MRIPGILNLKKQVLSFEVFPPKTWDNYQSVKSAVDDIAKLSPDFISVTYGAGGGTSDYTVDIVKHIKNYGITPLAHLSCISSTKEEVLKILGRLKELGIKNVLALRGDIPNNFNGNLEYRYASDLVKEIADFGGFCIGGACYPEGHPESPTLYSDIDNLKRKVDCGCDFLTTQMFFDNDLYYSFLSKVRDAGIYVPVIAGVMPVTNGAQIKRMMALSGGTLPTRFKRIIDKFGDKPAAMKQAGIAYVTEQIIDLYANGVRAVHVYSMNKPDVATAIKANLSEIL
ncbi:MAG: methylenetetrahydrofolate reductase [NAD(P)H] [Clostridia bacterium]|nr:methylenetetrahydrofolate reductase [NAD(P)H] [Clostridia bacterium]